MLVNIGVVSDLLRLNGAEAAWRKHTSRYLARWQGAPRTVATCVSAPVATADGLPQANDPCFCYDEEEYAGRFPKLCWSPGFRFWLCMVHSCTQVYRTGGLRPYTSTICVHELYTFWADTICLPFPVNSVHIWAAET